MGLVNHHTEENHSLDTVLRKEISGWEIEDISGIAIG